MLVSWSLRPKVIKIQIRIRVPLRKFALPGTPSETRGVVTNSITREKNVFIYMYVQHADRKVFQTGSTKLYIAEMGPLTLGLTLAQILVLYLPLTQQHPQLPWL